MTIVTLLIFTAAFAAAAELAWWGPRRRIRLEIDQRLRGLRLEKGRRPGSLLREQKLTGVSFLGRLEMMKRVQDMIDQARLPYRASNVLVFSLLLLAGGYLAADLLQLFSFFILRLLFAMGLSIVPIMYIRTKRSARMRQIEEMLPDAIDLFTRAMRAGHNIHGALQVLAEETPEPLGGEFKKLVEDLTLGSTVTEALHSLGDRVPLLDLRFFSTGVILQRETGANIVTVMENLSAVIRERLQLRARLRAHTAQQRFSAALLCSLPIVSGIAFYFMRYDYISVLWLTPAGSQFLVYGVISEIVGILVIRRIASVRL
ncbi:MAG: type II secretion system F family protein [Acidobacteria bacterium]|nr:type II secretion system F family protein [Acidobacteriota bacterium]